jgi:hypothetical protein
MITNCSGRTRKRVRRPNCIFWYCVPPPWRIVPLTPQVVPSHARPKGHALSAGDRPELGLDWRS